MSAAPADRALTIDTAPAFSPAPGVAEQCGRVRRTGRL